MPVSKSDLSTLSKDEVVDVAYKQGSKISRFNSAAKRKAEETSHLAIGSAAAFALGYYQGMTKGKAAAEQWTTEQLDGELQWFGMDRDLVISGGLAVLGMTGMGGKRVSNYARSAGNGALGYSLGSLAERMAVERALEAGE